MAEDGYAGPALSINFESRECHEEMLGVKLWKGELSEMSKMTSKKFPGRIVRDVAWGLPESKPMRG